MATDNTYFAPVLPSFDGFFDALDKTAKKGGEQAGKTLGDSLGKSLERSQGAVDKATKTMERAHSRAADAADNTRIAELKLAEVMEKGNAKASEIATATARLDKARRNQEAADKAAARSSDLLADAQQNLAKKSAEAGDAIEIAAGEAESAGGAFEGLGGKIGGMMTAFAGIAGVGALVSEGMDISGQIDLMNVQMGTTGAAAEAMAADVTAVMKSGFGAEDATAAIGSLNSQFRYLGSEGEQTAVDLSDNFLAFSTAFGVDMAEATQTAGQLIKNGLAGDVEEAADLMTAAMQRVPVAMQDELPEIINEYGVNFAALGFSGQEAFGMLVAQAENGKWALDKTGDALKEFTIRGSDMSTASVAAFESMGLSAEDMARKLATGGAEGREALELTAKGLLDIEDPAERANTAIALFGTPLEDMSIDQIPAFLDGLSGAEGAMAGFEGASQSAADVLGNSVQGRFATLKGVVMGLAADGFMALWDAGEKVAEWARNNGSWLGPLTVGIGAMATVIGGVAVAQNLWNAGLAAYKTIQAIATGQQLLFNASLLANPITWVVAAIAGLVAGLVYFFTQTETGQAVWESFTNALAAGWDWVVEKLSAGWAWLRENVFVSWDTAVAGIKASWQYTVDTVSAAWTWLTSALSAGWETIKTAVFDAWNWYVAQVQANWTLVTNALSAAWNWVKDMFIGAWNIIKTAVFDAWNIAVNTVQTVFSTVTGALSASWTWLKDRLYDGFVWVKDNVFGGFQTALDVLKNAFGVAVDGIQKLWDGIKAAAAKPVKFVIQRVFNDGVVAAWNKVAGWVGLDPISKYEPSWLGSYAEGTSRVPGARTKHDNVHMVSTDGKFGISLRGGESVLVPEVTDALGPAQIDGMNAAAKMGGTQGVLRYLGGFANGGVIGSITDLVNRFYPGMSITSTLRPGDPGHHGTGNAVDFSNGTDSTPQMRSAAQFFYKNYGPALLELIHSPFSNNVKNGQNVGDGFGLYGAGTMAGHRNHVHVAAAGPLPEPGDPITPVPSGGIGGGVVNWLRSKVADTLDGIFGPIGSAIPDFGGMIGGLPKAAFGKMTGVVSDFIRGKADESGAYHGAVGGGVEQWRGLVESVLTSKGFGVNLADTVLRRMDQESGGDPRAINNWDSNAAAGIPSKGLMQVIDPTFAAHKDPGFDDIWDPESNLRASMNYAVATYGSLPAAYNKAGGYHDGGLAPAGQGMLPKTAMEPEMVLSPAMTDAFIEWMRGTPQGESAAVVARELAEAFRGGDWGYGELASYIGEDIAKAAVDVVAAVGRADRGFREWAAGDEERARMGTPAEWAQHYGAQAGVAVADDVLGLFGLGGIVGGKFKDSFVDMINAGADVSNDVYGTNFGHMRGDMLQARAVIDDEGRVIEVSPTSAPVAVAEPVAAAPVTSAVSDSAVGATAGAGTTVIEMEGGKVYGPDDLVKLNEHLGDVEFRVKKIEDDSIAPPGTGVGLI